MGSRRNLSALVKCCSNCNILNLEARLNFKRIVIRNDAFARTCLIVFVNGIRL